MEDGEELSVGAMQISPAKAAPRLGPQTKKAWVWARAATARRRPNRPTTRRRGSKVTSSCVRVRAWGAMQRAAQEVGAEPD
eukprot:349851-Chlamydomonas_euryale.AAC.1